MVKPIFLTALLLTTLTGCGHSILDESDGRCPFKDRGGCQSMERVNEMVTARRFTPDGQFVQQADIVRAIALKPGCCVNEPWKQ